MGKMLSFPWGNHAGTAGEGKQPVHAQKWVAAGAPETGERLDRAG